MISILFIIFTTITFYLKAKKENLYRIKWTTIGLIISVIPMLSLPMILNNIAGKDVGGVGVMAGIICVMIISAILQKQIKNSKK